VLKDITNEIGWEVWIIAGQMKGYRGMLVSVSRERCVVALFGHPSLQLKNSDVATR
jgi:hypothetical protein